MSKGVLDDLKESQVGVTITMKSYGVLEDNKGVLGRFAMLKGGLKYLRMTKKGPRLLERGSRGTRDQRQVQGCL